MTTFSGEEYCKVSKYKWFMDWRQNIGHEHSVARGNGSQGTMGFLQRLQTEWWGKSMRRLPPETPGSWERAFMLRRAREIWLLKEVRCNENIRAEWMRLKEMRMRRSLVNSWMKSTKRKRGRFRKMGNRGNLVLRTGTWEQKHKGWKYVGTRTSLVPSGWESVGSILSQETKIPHTAEQLSPHTTAGELAQHNWAHRPQPESTCCKERPHTMQPRPDPAKGRDKCYKRKCIDMSHRTLAPHLRRLPYQNTKCSYCSS